MGRGFILKKHIRKLGRQYRTFSVRYAIPLFLLGLAWGQVRTYVVLEKQHMRYFDMVHRIDHENYRDTARLTKHVCVDHGYNPSDAPRTPNRNFAWLTPSCELADQKIELGRAGVKYGGLRPDMQPWWWKLFDSNRKQKKVKLGL